MPPTLPNPLLDLHRESQAELQLYGEIEIVATFGEPESEYSAIRKSCALMDLPQRGVLELSGKDRLPFLNNLITNQVFDKQTKMGLSEGEGVYAFLLDSKTGRILTDLNVLERGDRTWLEMAARDVESTRTVLDRYLFAEQVKIVSRVGDLHELALHGPGAGDVLRQLGVENADVLPPLGSRTAKLFDREIAIFCDDPAAVSGYYLIVPADSATPIWAQLVERFGQPTELGKRTVRRVGWAAFNACRIEGGRALFGIDFDPSVLPAETGQLERAVSFTKGCYPGQEIVARMHARKQVARKLVGIKMESDALPIAGTKVLDDNSNEIGGITSSTVSPILSNVALCLGYLKRPFFAVGTSVNIPAEGALRKGTVVETPFLSR